MKVNTINCEDAGTSEACLPKTIHDNLLLPRFEHVRGIVPFAVKEGGCNKKLGRKGTRDMQRGKHEELAEGWEGSESCSADFCSKTTRKSERERKERESSCQLAVRTGSRGGDPLLCLRRV